MIVFSTKRHYTGGKGRFAVRKLTADSILEWDRLVSTVNLMNIPDVWWVERPLPDKPWPATAKRQVVLWCREDHMQRVIAQTGAVQVPEGYWQLCGGALRHRMWLEWDETEREDAHDKEFWRRKLKWLAGQVFRSGDYVADPEIWDGGDVVAGLLSSEAGAVSAVKTWNAWIENFDLAQHRRVKPNPTPRAPQAQRALGIPVDPAKFKVLRTLKLEPNQVEYAKLTPEGRSAERRAKPWLTSLWASWEVLWEGGTMFPEQGLVAWLEPVKQTPTGTE